ncbi:rhodopsin, GQ-coupled isoform X2 [Hydra vulgaris]|uniref:Rhodopsin, GQ-coupled isoform X2 n=1 Tax=Hydra vulgaris TaxID=6087 RepID=A0ABM4CXJ5_HYDVU
MINKTDKYFSQYSESTEIILAVVLVFIMLLSFFGNVGMLIVFYRNDKLWNSTNMLIVNISLSGVLVTIFSMPFSLTSVVLGKWPFNEGGLCKVNAFATSQLLLTTILTHTVISLDKYFAVVKPFCRVMTVKRTLKMIMCVWFIAAVITVLPFFGIGRYTYNHTTLVCGVGFPDKHNVPEKIYLITLAVIGFVIPNMIMGHAYIQVFIAVKKHTQRLIQSSVTSFDVLILQKRMIRTVILSLVCFLLCWSPFCTLCLLAVMVKTINDIPIGLGISAYWCGYLYSALNPLIICSMSQRFHDGLIELVAILLYYPTLLFMFICRKICSESNKTMEISSKPTFTEDSSLPLCLHMHYYTKDMKDISVTTNKNSLINAP